MKIASGSRSLFRILYLSLLILLLTIYPAYAQTLTGQIFESDTKQSIPGATVTVNRLPDSVRIAGTVTNVDGVFEFDQLPSRDTLFMEVRSIGFKVFHRKLYLTGHGSSMDSIFLEENVTELQGIEVTAERPAVVTRGDTVEYHAGSYEALPYAEVSELIGKLPGISVDQNGDLTFNGRNIAKILVDGREYFGHDGQLALSSLPVDVVEKIQVMNASGLDQELAENDDQESKVLNIQLKEDLKMFGNMLGGGGTSGRYEAMGMANYFNGDSRFAVTGLANNVNITRYGQQSNALSIISSGNGITETWGAGLNYSDKLHQKVDISGSINYNHPTTRKESLSSRTQFMLPDSSFFTDANAEALDQANNLGIKASVSFTPNQSEEVELSVNGLRFTDTKNETINTNTTSDQNGNPVNRLENVYHANYGRFSLPLSVGWHKTFSNKTSIRINGFSRWSGGSGNDLNTGSTIFFKENGQDSTTDINQEIVRSNVAANYGLRAHLSLPVTQKLSVQLANDLRIGDSGNKTQTWTINENKERLTLDTLYSNTFSSKTLAYMVRPQLMYKISSLWMSAGAAVNYNYMRQHNETGNTRITQETTNISPQLRFGYRSAENSSVTLSYSASTSQPSVHQLQPIVNNTNPLFIREGNPDLRPTFKQSYDLRYHSLSEKGQSIQATLSYRPVNNQIINTVSVDEDGRQTSGYINVDGVMSLSSSLQYGMQKKWEKSTLRFNTRTYSHYARDKGFINENLTTSTRIGSSPNLKVNYEMEDLVSLEVGYSPYFTKVSYEYAQSQDQQYTVHKLQGTLDLYLTKNFYWRNYVNHTYNGSLPADFRRSALFWNLELSYLVLADKKGEIKLKVYDLLRQNQNTSRTVNNNYIETTQSNNLQQYAMLSFRYHIR